MASASANGPPGSLVQAWRNLVKDGYRYQGGQGADEHSARLYGTELGTERKQSSRWRTFKRTTLPIRALFVGRYWR